MDNKGDDPLHVKVQPVRHVQRQICRVCSVQDDGGRQQLQAPDGAGVTQDGHDHLLVCRCRGTVNHDQIAIMDARAGHSIPFDPHKEGGGWVEDQ